MTPITEEAPVAPVDMEHADLGQDLSAAPAESDTAGAEPAQDSAEVQAVADRELRGILEALLFVSPEPLTVQRLLSVVGDVSKADLLRALQGLGEELDREGRGIRLAEIAGGYRLVTKQEHAAWIKRLDKSKSTAKLSRSALESLAIIAYKQPIVKSEIEEIRGVETSGVVRTLLERKLVRIVGRKEVPGRPIMYGTTKFFLEHFGLKDLSQLPPLREFKELGESEQSLLPIGEGESVAGEIEPPVMDGARAQAEAIVEEAIGVDLPGTDQISLSSSFEVHDQGQAEETAIEEPAEQNPGE